MKSNEIDIIGKTYYMHVDTSTITGKLEQRFTDMFHLSKYKHIKDGSILLNYKKQTLNNTKIKITWRFDKHDVNVMYYDFFIKLFNKYIGLGKLRYDVLHIDKNLNIHGKGYIFNKHMFDFYLTPI